MIDPVDKRINQIKLLLIIELVNKLCKYCSFEVIKKSLILYMTD